MAEHSLPYSFSKYSKSSVAIIDYISITLMVSLWVNIGGEVVPGLYIPKADRENDLCIEFLSNQPKHRDNVTHMRVPKSTKVFACMTTMLLDHRLD